MSQPISSSQEILFSSQSSVCDENNDSYRVSTQEILNSRSQEAINASEFLLSLRDSQVNASPPNGPGGRSQDTKPYSHRNSNYTEINAKTHELNDDSDIVLNLRDSQNTGSPYKATGGHRRDIKPNVEELNQYIVCADFESKPLVVVEKKKRGRKRKIRTEEEMDLHLKDKKEKNRLAAQRLRQRKCSEVAKYDKEVEQYEKMVKIKKNFAQHLESKVEQLRNRIKAMTHNNTNTSNSNNNNNNNNNNKLIKSESIQSSNHLNCNLR